MEEFLGLGESSPSIIGRKIRPPSISDGIIQRSRLSDHLRGLLDQHRVVVVAATAGAGKTTALVDALEARDGGVAWLTVDEPDQAPGRLLAYLEASVQSRVPAARRKATAALAEGFSHREAAGALADSLGERELIVVLEDLDRLPDDAGAWQVIGSFLRFAPPAVRVVLASRRPIPQSCDLPDPAAVGWIGDEDLAFTNAEATEALARRGAATINVEEIVSSTAGWVAGVLFEAWRSTSHVAGQGGEADPLFGYLGSQILSLLDADTRSFLIRSSPLGEVDVRRATAIGLPAAAEHLAALRKLHIPVSWDATRSSLRCHPRFREYLRSLLALEDDAELRRLQLAYGRLLASERHYEEATDALLEAGVPAEAAKCAGKAIIGVVERLDLDHARRWLIEFAELPGRRPVSFAVAELMVCWAEEDYRGAERVADELQALGAREALARRSGRAGALMAWCYFMRGRGADAKALLAETRGSEAEAVSYLIGGRLERQPRPDLSGGPFDLFVLLADYFGGRLNGLTPTPASSWTSEVVTAWQVGVLRAGGRTAEAMVAYEQAVAETDCQLGLLTSFAPDIFIDAGDVRRAREVLIDSRAHLDQIGARAWSVCMALVEARLELRMERSPAAARRALDAIKGDPCAESWLFRAAMDTWYGFADLLDGDDEAALARLRLTIERICACDGSLELCAAAVYLAEAEARAGDLDAATRAADLALAAASRLGSNHLLLQALADFPAVLSRRIETEAQAGSPWRELARAMASQGVAIQGHARPRVLVREFGEARILVDDKPLPSALSKSVALLSHLVHDEHHSAERSDLLGILFDGRTDRSALSYLRQILHRLRTQLPDGTLIVTDGSIRLGDGVAVTSESQRLEEELSQAARLRGADRCRATEDALSRIGDGTFLRAISSTWATRRRREVSGLRAAARLDIATLRFAAGDLWKAQAHCERAIREQPGREAAWRLLIRISRALGDDDGVAESYRRCEEALAELGRRPGAMTSSLVSA